MDRNLKQALIWLAVGLAGGILIMLLNGCVPEYRVSMCRHRAVECALVYGEVYGPSSVGIAIGPASGEKWHGQAYLETPQGRKWLVSLGYGCEIGDREPFEPARDFSVKGFMDYQFGQFQ